MHSGTAGKPVNADNPRNSSYTTDLSDRFNMTASNPGPHWLSIAGRSCALFLGCFTLINLIGGWVWPGFDANIWWVDTRSWPLRLDDVLLGGAGTMWLALAVHPRSGQARKMICAVLTVTVLGIVLFNAVTFYALLAKGQIAYARPVPVTLLVAVMLMLVWNLNSGSSVTYPQGRTRPIRDWIFISSILMLMTITAPLVQMWGFGNTDYRRPADAIVVFGARAYADGRPSVPLSDRVTTACDLYHQGYAPRLIFSGGPGDGDIHETQAMRRLALKLDVPDSAILIDRTGLNTRATVAYSDTIMQTHGMRRILAVSHSYHLPRIKLAYQRQGIAAFTVPARESYTLTALPYYMLREVAAFWAYYAQIRTD